ncbi:imine reductase family protein [Pedobacter frigoris]|uniref:NAD(P)-dependent oxidoreductase n=1 Tax=Pedobacter frigoris TaxID=2571272 RepID=A0A4U1CGH3_9SPHI|nr:NAD(P)-binding domain-containing protein [Pedobacter frigoris]TKC05804.1 NAD(P)-dependent oxidoreductase [Pedobacter frigoris]
MKNNLKNIGLIGLGKMGQLIGTILLDKNYKISVWNRTSTKTDKLSDKGATVETGIENIIKGNELIIITLSNYKNIYEIFKEIDNFNKAHIVNLTSGSPTAANELSKWITDKNGNYLDGAMLAIPETLGTDEANLIFSGNSQSFKENKSELSLLGNTHYLGTSPDYAEMYDTALLSASYGALAGFFNATLIAEIINVKPTDFIKLLVPWLTSIVQFMPHLANEIEHKSYNNGDSNIDINQVAVEHLIHSNLLHNIPTNLHKPLNNYLQKQVEMGNEKKSFSIIYESLKKERKALIDSQSSTNYLKEDLY